MNSSEWLKLNLPQLSDPADIMKLTQNFEWLDTFINSLSNTHKEFERRIQKLELSDENINSSVFTIRTDIAAVQRELIQLSAKHETDIATLQISISNLNALVTSLKSSFNQLSLKVDTIDKKLDDSIKTVNQNMAAEVSKLDERIKKLESATSEIKITSFKSSPRVALAGSEVDVRLEWMLNTTASSLTVNGTTVSGTGYTVNRVSSNSVFTLIATDKNGNTDTATSDIKFMNEVLWGSSTDSAPSSTTLSNLISKEMSEEIARTFSVNTGSGAYIYYAFPKRLGTVKFYTLGILEGGFKLPAVISYKNSAGYSEEYYVYRSANKLTGNTEVTAVKEV